MGGVWVWLSSVGFEIFTVIIGGLMYNVFGIFGKPIRVIIIA